MTIHRINSNDRLSAAATFEALVFLSGQVPTHTQDIAAQTEEVLGKIDALLAEAGSDKDHILNATIYVQNIQRDFAAMNAVWSAWLSAARLQSAWLSRRTRRASRPAGTPLPGASAPLSWACW